MYLGKVYVTLKPTVNDPQGLTVLGGLHSLGFEAVKDVRIGKYLELLVAESEQAEAERLVAEMCDRLLANPVIENYRFELAETEDPLG